MATLRSGRRLDPDTLNNNDNEEADTKKKQPPVKDRTTLVVFGGLLIDLLGDARYRLMLARE